LSAASGVGAGTAREAVERAARGAAEAAPALAAADDPRLDAVLREVAAGLRREAAAILEANGADVAAAEGRLSGGVLDRLRLDEGRLDAIAVQVERLAELPAVPREPVDLGVREGVRIAERRVPVGVIGANYEARANVTVDIASQLVKSRNAGVLRTGAAALATAEAVVDLAVAPALRAHGLPEGAVGLVRSPDRDAARLLCTLPDLVPLVILRGSGETTRALADVAAAHGVRTLAHAEGGGVLYVHPAADRALALRLVESSLDRLGVCNRLNLLLLDPAVWDELLSPILALLQRLGLRASLPPHDHPLGHEWATDEAREATVTLAPADGPLEAAALANRHTSGLAACICTADAEAARAFLDAYRGTGAFWNATTRLLDGFKLTGAPETGINVDHVPGPRGPVTYRDLWLRQYVITPASDA
jgi:glutamate-5-semialdehyde dehydrogenase